MEEAVCCFLVALLATFRRGGSDGWGIPMNGFSQHIDGNDEGFRNYPLPGLDDDNGSLESDFDLGLDLYFGSSLLAGLRLDSVRASLNCAASGCDCDGVSATAISPICL